MANTARWTAPPGQGVAILYVDRANRLTGAYMNCPHCDTHIDEHEATRCLDAWTAEVVMGHSNIRKEEDSWEYCLYDGDCHEPYGVNCFFSTSISAAFLVVDKFGGGGFLTIQGYLYEGRTNYWYVGKRGHIGVRAETLPLAICRAAIKVSQ